MDEQANNFYFIQQALSKINNASEQYKEVNATIWLTKGDHFFFYCDKKVNYAPTTPIVNDTTVYDYKPLKHDILCSIDSMKAAYPKKDNINI